MPHISGTAGQVDAATNVSGIKSWTLEYTYAVLDTTDFADTGVSSFIPGISSWNGTFEGYKMTTPLVIGSELAIKLWEATGGSDAWNGDAIITSVSANTDHDGLVSYSYTFQGTGALTIPS